MTDSTENVAEKRKPYQKTLAVMSVLGLTFSATACGPQSANPIGAVQPTNAGGSNSPLTEVVEEIQEPDEDDDDLFVYTGSGHYIPYRSYSGSMAGASMVTRRNGTYVPYTGPKHPPSWTSNPSYAKPSTSSGTGNVVRKSASSSSSSSFGSAGSSSSFGSSSSGARASSGVSSGSSGSSVSGG